MNLSGTLNAFRVLVRPRLILPAAYVADIRELDFACFKRQGYSACIFDKDNCLTKPHEDHLVPELQEAWAKLIQTFGRDNVLIVSNSAGTNDDPGFVQAESVSRSLGVPVLLHSTKKPGCLNQIEDYFSRRQKTPQPLKIIVVGDRPFTDIVLGRRLSTLPSIQALPILTTHLWKREGLLNQLLRLTEQGLLRLITRYAPKIPAEEWLECIVRTPPKPPSTAARIAAATGSGIWALVKGTVKLVRRQVVQKEAQ